MKKILISLICLLVAFVGRAQFNITQNLGSPNTLVKNPNYGGLQGGLIPFTFADTTAANLTNLKYYAGALIYTSSPRAVWWRDLTAQQWVQVLPSGGSTGTLAWVMGGNNPVVSDGSGNAILGPQTNNGIAFMSNNLQRVILPAGGLTLKQLVSDTTLNKPMVWNTSTKEWNYGYWFSGASTIPISSLTAATGTNTIDNTNYEQQWNWSTLQSGTALHLSSTSTAGDTDPTMLEIEMVGANSNSGVETYGLQIGVTKTGTTSTNIGLYVASSGATTNYSAIFARGIAQFGLVGTESGQLDIIGITSGIISIKPQAAAGTFNFNLPTTAGTSGYLLTSAGGGASAMTWTNPASLSTSLTSTYIGYGSAGNAVTGDANLTYTAASSAVALDSGYLSFTGHKAYGSAVNGSIFRSSLYGLTTRAVTGSSYDWLLFSAGGNTILANPTGTDNFLTSGKFGFGSLGLTPSALVNIAAGTATANTAPLKFTSGTNLTTAEAGAVEYNGSNFFMTATATNRRQVALSNVATPTSGYLLVGNGTDWTITAPGSVTGLNYISALTNGVGTTANSTAVDLGGTVGTDVAIDEDGGNDQSFDIGRTTAFANIRFGALNFALNGGPVQMNNYGAGTATFDASGNITSVSDMRLKNLQGMYGVGLKQLMQINPIVYKYNAKSKLDTVHNYIGFSAQNIKDALGDNAVGVNKDGYYSLQDRAILAVLTNSVKELKELNDTQQKEIDNLKKEVRKLKK